MNTCLSPLCNKACLLQDRVLCIHKLSSATASSVALGGLFKISEPLFFICELDFIITSLWVAVFKYLAVAWRKE